MPDREWTAASLVNQVPPSPFCGEPPPFCGEAPELRPTPFASGYSTLREVARHRQQRGDLLGALQAYRHAAWLAELRRDPQWRGLLLTEIGHLYLREGAPQLARPFYGDALNCFDECRDLTRQGEALLQLARVAWLTGELETAQEYYQRALRCAPTPCAQVAPTIFRPAFGGGASRAQRVAATMAGTLLLSSTATGEMPRFSGCLPAAPPMPPALPSSEVPFPSASGTPDSGAPGEVPAAEPRPESDSGTPPTEGDLAPETPASSEAEPAPPDPNASDGDGGEPTEPTAAEPQPVPPGEPSPAPATEGKAPGEPPAGHSRSLAVPRVEQAPTADGRLDDSCWQGPAPATDFWVSETDRAPQDATEVWVAADEKALHVAFRCRDSQPEAIFAEQTKRDASLGFDDRVTVQIDPYHNHRSISEFSVNAIGTQADSMAGGRARKIEWKGEWKAAAVRTAEGWTAEFTIPFSVLNYAPGTTTFGVNFLRYQHRAQETSRWADVTPVIRAEEMGHLTGLRPPARSAPPVSLMTYTTGGLNTTDRTGRRQPFVAGTGLDVRYNASNSLTGMASLHPDFSQVEDEVTDLAFSYNEKLLPDRRPFFQEGGAFFGRSRTFFHSGRIPDFTAGAKLFGRLGAMQMGVLGVSAPGGRSDYVARAVREFGARSHLELTAVQSQQRQFSNQLLALEGSTRSARGLTASLNLASTHTRGRAGDGTMTSLSLGRETPYLQFGVNATRIGQFFFPANGYVAGDQLSTIGGSAYASYQREYADHRLRTVSANLGYSGRNTLSGLLQNRNLFVDLSVETRSQRQLTLGYSAGPYRPRGKEPGEWSSTVYQDRLMTASLYFNTRSSRGGYGVTYAWGELGGGPYSNLSPSFWWKPDAATSLSYSYERAFSFGTTRQGVLNMSWDLDRQQSLGLRWVEYQGKAYWRVAFRRAVIRGIDVYAVFNREPDKRDRFVLKLVRSLR